MLIFTQLKRGLLLSIFLNSTYAKKYIMLNTTYCAKYGIPTWPIDNKSRSIRIIEETDTNTAKTWESSSLLNFDLISTNLPWTKNFVFKTKKGCFVLNEEVNIE